MADHAHSTPPKVPADMLAQHRAGWNAFTRFTVYNCVALAVLLLILLLAFKIF